MYKENITPKKIPNKVADVPIIIPTKKNILIIDLFNTPIDFKIAISRVLFFTKIVKPEIILKAATIIIKDKIITLHYVPLLMLKIKNYSYQTKYKQIHY